MKKVLSAIMTLAILGGILCMPVSAQENMTNNVATVAAARAQYCPGCGPVANITEKSGGEYNVLVKTENYGTFTIKYYEVRQDYVYICPGCKRYLGFAYTSVVRTYTQRVDN